MLPDLSANFFPNISCNFKIEQKMSNFFYAEKHQPE
jgi:hypothetical protein